MSRVAIVTGGNKGVGFATCRGLSKKFNGDVYLTARSSERGMAAVAELLKEGCTVHFHQLDIDDPSSIEKMRDFMKKKYDGIDVLINNAAIAFKGNATEPMGVQADLTCKTNYWSTKNVCDLLFPTLKPGARVVNVSSSAGKLSTMPDSDLKKKMASSGFGLTVSNFLYF
jgi:carbonyl reductase 1